jgi:hypothetical protein
MRAIIILCLVLFVVGWGIPAAAQAERPLASLAREVQSKGAPAEDFDKFAQILGVEKDDGSLRVIRFKHGGRIRMVWTRILPNAGEFDVFFADFRPEFGLLFYTDEDAALRRAVRLAQDIPPVELSPAEARADFERERDYWLRWAR